MIEEKVLLGLRNMKSEKDNNINQMFLQMERLKAFAEAYQIAIDLVEREIEKAKKESS